MAPAVAALRVVDTSWASTGAAANASGQATMPAASLRMLRVDMEILWSGPRTRMRRGKEVSGVILPGSCGRRPLHENGPHALPFEGRVDRAPDRTRAMQGARRDHYRLPRRQCDPLAAIYVDLQRAGGHKEQFIRLRVVMPAVLALEHRKAPAVVVDVEQPPVVVIGGDGELRRAHVRTT